MQRDERRRAVGTAGELTLRPDASHPIESLLRLRGQASTRLVRQPPANLPHYATFRGSSVLETTGMRSFVLTLPRENTFHPHIGLRHDLDLDGPPVALQ